MSFARAVRAVAATSVLAMAVGVVTTTSAEAKPTRPGIVTGLHAAATEPVIGTYRVSIDWNALSCGIVASSLY